MSKTTKDKIIEMLEKGMKQVEIAKKLGYSKQYVSHVIKEKNYKYLRGAKYINSQNFDITICTFHFNGRAYFL